MRKTQRKILGITGVISAILGIVASIPSYLQGDYGVAIFGTTFLIGGLVLIAIAFGD